MMRPLLSSLALALLIAASARAQQSSLPPIRPLGPVVATARDSFVNVTGVRALPGGRVLVNEPSGRRVLMYDSTLASPVVIADSTGATANAYSGPMAGLVPYRGDSTLFVDPMSMSMLVIDPAGKVGRVMSVPRTQDAMFLVGGAFGTPGFDAAGRLVYRASNFTMAGPPMRGANGMPHVPTFPDSAALVRVDLATRKLDTLAFIRVPKTTMHVSQDANGRVTMQSEVNPLPVVDEWAVLPDGSIAIVRGRDYHVDLIAADGAKRSAPKLPFEWQRLSDEDKVAFIDSVKAARERMGANAPMGNANIRMVMPGSGSAPPPSGAAGEQRVMIMGGPPPAGGARPGEGSGARMELLFVSPSELPDYKPAFFAGALRVDPEGNLWIRTIPTRAIPGGPVYDVVDAKGALVERVQVPANRQIVGFGPGGAVYLLAREGTGKATLERARVR
jgi:hypothetical protein